MKLKNHISTTVNSAETINHRKSKTTKKEKRLLLNHNIIILKIRITAVKRKEKNYYFYTVLKTLRNSNHSEIHLNDSKARVHVACFSSF